MRQRFPPVLAFLALLAAGCANVSPPASNPVRESAGECRASPDSARPQLVIGYGSLMQDASRTRTSPNAGPAHPVEVSGYERGWLERGSPVGFSTTYLGLRIDASRRMNAVAYEIDRRELAATDARESSYCRRPVARAAIASLDPSFSLPGEAEVWIYVTDPARIAAPDARYPIVESYVDVFLSGCLEQEERFHLKGFARECIATTSGWSEHWVNDRIYPRRPFVFEPRAGEIDRLLSTSVPGYFARIRIEPGGR